MKKVKKQDFTFKTPNSTIVKFYAEGGFIDSVSAPFNDIAQQSLNATKQPVPPVSIKDDRKVNPVTNKAINPNSDLKSGQYDRETIQAIVQAANRFKVDPYQALAVGLQETRLGKDNKNEDGINIGHNINYDATDSIPEGEWNKMSEVQRSAHDMAYGLQQSAQKAKKMGYSDPAMALQAYNGFGKLFTDTEKDFYGNENKSFYGVDVTKKPLDLKKNPAYGKTVLSIADMLKNNQDINDIVNPYNTKQEKPQELTGGTYDVGTTGSRFKAGGKIPEYGNGGTVLTPQEQSKYQQWRSKLPQNLQYEGDYDLKGLWKSNPNVQPSSNLHFPDTYKLPNHPTFSDESIYNGQNGQYGGTWQEDTFYPSKQEYITNGRQFYEDYSKRTGDKINFDRFDSGTNSPIPFVYKYGGAVPFNDVEELKQISHNMGTYKSGGKIKIKPSKVGSLHTAVGVPQGQKIPASKLKIKSTDSPALKKKKQFAINFRKDGGYVTDPTFMGTFKQGGYASLPDIGQTGTIDVPDFNLMFGKKYGNGGGINFGTNTFSGANANFNQPLFQNQYRDQNGNGNNTINGTIGFTSPKEASTGWILPTANVGADAIFNHLGGNTFSSLKLNAGAQYNREGIGGDAGLNYKAGYMGSKREGYPFIGGYGDVRVAGNQSQGAIGATGGYSPTKDVRINGYAGYKSGKQPIDAGVNAQFKFKKGGKLNKMVPAYALGLPPNGNYKMGGYPTFAIGGTPSNPMDYVNGAATLAGTASAFIPNTYGNVGDQTAKDALMYGAEGAKLGSAFGPVGAGIGAGIGAIGGGIYGYANGQKENRILTDQLHQQAIRNTPVPVRNDLQYGNFAMGGMARFEDGGNIGNPISGEQFNQSQDSSNPVPLPQQGQAPQQPKEPTYINIERGEGIVRPNQYGNYDTVQDFKNPNRFFPHEKSQMKEAHGNFIEANPDDIVIDKPNWKKFQASDKVGKDTIVRKILERQADNPMQQYRMKQGGFIPVNKYDIGGPITGAPSNYDPSNPMSIASLYSSNTPNYSQDQQNASSPSPLAPNIPGQRTFGDITNQAIGGMSQYNPNYVAPKPNTNTFANGFNKVVPYLGYANELAGSFKTDPQTRFTNPYANKALSTLENVPTTYDINANLANNNRDYLGAIRNVNRNSNPATGQAVQAQLLANKISGNNQLYGTKLNEENTMRTRKADALSNAYDRIGTQDTGYAEKYQDASLQTAANQRFIRNSSLAGIGTNYQEQNRFNNDRKNLGNLSQYFSVDENGQIIPKKGVKWSDFISSYGQASGTTK